MFEFENSFIIPKGTEIEFELPPVAQYSQIISILTQKIYFILVPLPIPQPDWRTTDEAVSYHHWSPADDQRPRLYFAVADSLDELYEIVAE